MRVMEVNKTYESGRQDQVRLTRGIVHVCIAGYDVT
jgi:hypothetical protein